ncbi:hypothetical protein FRB94_005244 [Tulasnella sp. JGI-2019a]|nr:hypothetical protein FRB94_005244 [Tulasnella sp. JGI-2019a]KAG9016219.1 hypothetical protein FRB93_011693 [Tulasnella sp. JGI-2019a]KAG9036467.1 hypothetical protein FRB95_008765 [Tulasnella sp. JGI-2019a]
MSTNIPSRGTSELEAGLPPASADSQALMRRNAFRGYQIASLAVPPLYFAVTLARRRPVSFNKVLVATMVGGATGAATGLGVGTLQYGGESDNSRVKLTYDANQIRLDDYATLGILLGAVLTPAILYRRTRLLFAICGGAGLGAGVGTATHYWKHYQDGQQVRPERIRTNTGI